MKDKCCCGATKKTPCVCMMKDKMECSKTSPKCPCYALLDKQNKGSLKKMVKRYARR